MLITKKKQKKQQYLSLIFFEKAEIWVVVKLLQKEINLCYVKLFKPYFYALSWKSHGNCYTKKLVFLF